MKTIKSLVLGSAAVLVAMGAAQAADLPLKAKAVEYVKVCSLYGAGFYYMPGTDTCIKLGGYLRVDVLANTNSDNSGNYSGLGGAQNRLTNAYTFRSRQDLTVDTRTATEYGVVRTFFDATFSWTSGGYAGTGTGATAYDAAPTGTSGSGSVAGGALGVYYAYIQFAGFTMGKAVSQFSAPWSNYPGNNFDGLVGGGGTVTGINQFTYTAQFGNGVSGTLSAQDASQYLQAGVNNTNLAGSYGSSSYGGNSFPDFVAMLRVDQAWGLFQASGALHNNHVGYYGATESTGHPDDKLGYAAMLALSIKNISTGPGDTINVQGVYTNGATRYNIQDLGFSLQQLQLLRRNGRPWRLSEHPVSLMLPTLCSAMVRPSSSSRLSVCAVRTPTTGMLTGTPVCTVPMPRSATTTPLRRSSVALVASAVRSARASLQRRSIPATPIITSVSWA